ncbi:MAG TPA: hemolysin family protein, partial [Gemmatimonadaceae bacterium]|nr:hemolysin family protein [Gemmatimonadaceae bacterium]
MSAILTEVVVILVLLLINGVFAMSEMAVVAAKKVRLEQRADEGDRGAAAALALASSPTQFLSTVQVGITLVGVLAGAFGGATISEKLAERFARVSWLAAYSEGAALAVVVAGITYLSLILGELVPKRVALGAPERIASAMARPMRLIARVASPLVRFLTASTELMLKLVPIKASGEPAVTEEDIRALVLQGKESGEVQEAEHRIVESAFRLGDRQAAAIMTPRHATDWVDVGEPPDALRRRIEGLSGREWFLACDGDLEHVLGVAYAADIFAPALAGRPLELKAMVQPPLFVPGTKPVYGVLETLQKARQHVAVVLDEFGGVQGTISIDQIVEELVGKLPAGAGYDEGTVVRRDDGSWL